MFYKYFIESVPCFSFVYSYFNLGVKNKNSLQKTIHIISKIIADIQRDITKFSEKHVLRNARSILVNESHVV